MVRRWLSLFVLLAGASPCLAQAEPAPAEPGPARNAVFFELLGNGGLYSFNYERMLTDDFGVRVGYAVWNEPLLFEGTPPDRYRAFPVTVSWLWGPDERKLELGGGALFGHGTFDRNESFREDFSFQSVTGIIGYRSQPTHGYLFRAGVTPFYSWDDEEHAYPQKGFTFSGGVSFGYRF